MFEQFYKWLLVVYRKIPKISPGAYIFQRPFFRGLSTEGNLRFKINWASLLVGIKFPVFALFYFVFEGNFHVQAPWGAYIWRGNLTEGFLRYEFGGLIFGVGDTWRGLFSEFYGTSERLKLTICQAYPIQLNTLPRSFVKMLLDNPCLTSLFQLTASSKLWSEQHENNYLSFKHDN